MWFILVIIVCCIFEVGIECFLKDVEVIDDFDWIILSVRDIK